ncbi:MAG: hypothetical protein LBH32_07705 [Dysgonamonadaceae bacterium]|nr:hypothetical protein [Dysgonamonadaceae bacterium]
MKSLERTLIEKAGYENSFENVKESDAADLPRKSDRVCLFSSRYPVTVEIVNGKNEGAWLVRFSDNISLDELQRGLNKPLFGPQGIEAWDREGE